MSRRKKISKLRRAKVPNIGIIIFFGIFVYILAYTLDYVNRDKTSIYRVISDTRANIINRTGVILRNETVLSTADSGYINYYVGGLSRVAKKDIVYTVDSTGSIHSKLSSDGGDKANSEPSFMPILRAFHTDGGRFSSVYQLKTTMKEAVLLESGHSIMTNLKGVLKNYGDEAFFHVNYAPESGIIVYQTDGMEKLTLSDINNKLFDRESHYSLKISPENSGKIEAGEPVYKLISEETWKVVFPITEEQKALLSEMKFADITLDHSHFSARAKVETMEREGESFAILTFYNYMVNFADRRFVNVSLEISKKSGLKIAKSSILEKKFFVIPNSLFDTKDEKTQEIGLYVLSYDKNGKATPVFVPTTIYYADEKFSYIATDGEIGAGSRIVKNKPVQEQDPDSEDFVVSKIETLQGVYNVNKGYPEFRMIEVLSEIEGDYCLISDKTEYGLYEYDNIVLNANVLEKEKQ